MELISNCIESKLIIIQLKKSESSFLSKNFALNIICGQTNEIRQISEK